MARFFLFFAALALLAFGWAVWLPRAMEQTPAPAPRDYAGDFSWRAFDGSAHSFHEFQGRPVALHFWASWCGPCRAEFPALLRLAATNTHLVVLAVSADTDREAALRFLREAERAYGGPKPANVLYAFDPTRGLTFDLFQTAVFPETILIDREGHLRRKIAGVADWQGADLQNYLGGL